MLQIPIERDNHAPLLKSYWGLHEKFENSIFSENLSIHMSGRETSLQVEHNNYKSPLSCVYCEVVITHNNYRFREKKHTQNKTPRLSKLHGAIGSYVCILSEVTSFSSTAPNTINPNIST